MSYLYSIILICSFIGANIYKHSLKKSQNSYRNFPELTFVLCSIFLLLYIIQYVHPQLLDLTRRDTYLIFSGQIWRLVTSLFFQDGGLMGATFNILSLLLIGSVAEYHMSTRHWLLFFFVGGIIAELVALFLQPVGAGNSVANFSLAGSLLTMTLFQNNRRMKIISAIGILASILLFFMKDIHGAAALIGMILFLLTPSRLNTFRSKP